MNTGARNSQGQQILSELQGAAGAWVSDLLRFNWWAFSDFFDARLGKEISAVIGEKQKLAAVRLDDCSFDSVATCQHERFRECRGDAKPAKNQKIRKRFQAVYWVSHASTIP